MHFLIICQVLLACNPKEFPNFFALTIDNGIGLSVAFDSNRIGSMAHEPDAEAECRIRCEIYYI
jgi:hypothetical protein